MEYSLEDLEKETCLSFGGNNCVLHGCMFNCALREAKKRAIQIEINKGRVFSEIDIENIFNCKKN